MPHVKMARKSTDTDMTPFVDIAFLILSFFIMATKFKPPEPIAVEPPGSVSSERLTGETNAMLITMDKDSKVYVTLNAKKGDEGRIKTIIQDLNTTRTLGLTDAEIDNFSKTIMIGVPFSSLKGLLDIPADQQKSVVQPGIPVLDTLNNELIWWIGATKRAFAGEKLLYLVKGDNMAKYPSFEAVINAFRKNEEFKYNLVTSQEGAPEGTELFIERLRQR